MTNKTLEELTEQATSLMDAIPDLLMNGAGDLYVREDQGESLQILTCATHADLLAWNHEARGIAESIRDTLASEPRRKTPKSATEAAPVQPSSASTRPPTEWEKRTETVT